MWPFTSRRIFGNRWWALAFVAFVCWQAVDFVGEAPGSGSAVAQGRASDEEQAMRDVADTLDAGAR